MQGDPEVGLRRFEGEQAAEGGLLDGAVVRGDGHGHVPFHYEVTKVPAVERESAALRRYPRYRAERVKARSGEIDPPDPGPQLRPVSGDRQRFGS
ncbi:hypothetical protein GCM10010289_31060 [Streptomyces violascens]|nr:hypothetical protein GCM10010289_31060 [Streptomyces violascens]